MCMKNRPNRPILSAFSRCHLSSGIIYKHPLIVTNQFSAVLLVLQITNLFH